MLPSLVVRIEVGQAGPTPLLPLHFPLHPLLSGEVGHIDPMAGVLDLFLSILDLRIGIPTCSYDRKELTTASYDCNCKWLSGPRFP